VRLPLLASLPHAGLRVPEEVAPYCILTPQQIAEDGDVGAAEVYDLESEFEVWVSTDVARAIVDQNRAEDDRRRDGVVKTHTCWDVPVYGEFPPESVVRALLDRYWRPYHARLTEGAKAAVRLGVDLHTMAAVGPPVGPDPGRERPLVCLSNAGTTCPRDWMETLRDCFRRCLGADVRINDPFKGGYITRVHAAELPWVQVELSRGPFMTHVEKRHAVLEALRRWCEQTL
jgi:N-formylglutamate amidohydrolase